MLYAFCHALVAEAAFLFLYDTPSSRTVGCLECRCAPQRRVYLRMRIRRRAETRPGSTEEPCRPMCILFRLEQRSRRRQRWKTPNNFTVRTADGPFFRAEYFPLSALPSPFYEAKQGEQTILPKGGYRQSKNPTQQSIETKGP